MVRKVKCVGHSLPKTHKMFCSVASCSHRRLHKRRTHYSISWGACASSHWLKERRAGTCECYTKKTLEKIIGLNKLGIIEIIEI